ncbi:MAG: hypothetical protein JMDDDDMK_01586 [Acidobacteria bacterium]|nr:hypothetical protein [Acidobacteriota bacterium]
MKSKLFRLCVLLTICLSTTTLLASHAAFVEGGSAACQLTITPLNQSFPATGGAGNVTINSSEPQCSWTALSNAPWITITSASSGTGNGSVNFTVAPAIGPRSGTLTVAGRTFTIWQSVNPCATPGFALPTPMAPTRGLLQFAIGDFNGDGRFDVITLAYTDQYVLAFAPGAGAGGFGAPQPIPLNFTPQNVTAIKPADFNRDGKLDLLIVSPSSNKVSVLLGNGSGGFGAPMSSDLSSSPPVYPGTPRQTVIADLNNDRNPDIVFCEEYSARLSILIGNGAGGFNPPLIHTPAETSGRGLMLSAGDFNGDGKTDLISLINGSFQFLFLPGDGTGGFGRGSTVSFVDKTVTGVVSPEDLALGDANGDGKLDVVVTSSKGLSITPGNGAGGFAEAVMPLRDQSGSIFLGDFNGDGRTDIALTSAFDLTLLRGLGNGNFAGPLRFTSAADNKRPNTALSLDFNRDGLMDLFLTTTVRNESNPVIGFVVVPGSRNTGFATPQGQAVNLTVNAFALKDLNGDDAPDLLMSYALDPGNSGFAVALGDGAGGFGAPVVNQQGSFVSYAIGDVNGDGKPDLVIAAQLGSASNVVKVWINSGAGAFSPGQQIAPSQTLSNVALADFNNDGKLDLVVNNDRDPSLKIFAGVGDGTFTTLTDRIPVNLIQTFTTGDFNGDGNTDLATWRQFNCDSENGTVFILSGDGRGGLAQTSAVTLAANPKTLVAADLNGDGRADLISTHCRNVEGNGVAVALADQNGGFTPAVNYASGEGGNILIGDINGDGKPDIVASSGLLVLINKGDGSFNDSIRLNSYSNASLGDINGDGTTDIVVSHILGGKSHIFPLLNLSRCLAPDGALAVSAASYSGVKLAPESIAALFGANLTSQTQAATGLPLPTELAGAGVKIKDSANAEHPAPLFFASPGQINFQIPPGASRGTAVISVVKGGAAVATGVIDVTPVNPALFSADASGAGYPAATVLRIKGDGAQSYEPVASYDQTQNRFVARPIDLGPPTDQVFLILFGTGLRHRSALSAVNANIGGENAEVLFAGSQDGFVGLDQINLRLPRSLAGRGEVDVVFTADGKTANAVKVNIK